MNIELYNLIRYIRLKTLKRRKTDTTQSKTSGNSHSIVEDGEESLEPEILARPCEVVLSSVGKALSAGASNRLGADYY